VKDAVTEAGLSFSDTHYKTIVKPVGVAAGLDGSQLAQARGLRFDHPYKKRRARATRGA